LSYDVTVAHLILVQFVQVRILVGQQFGRVIMLAHDLVLKTSGTEKYGDRYLTLPQYRVVEESGLSRCIWDAEHVSSNLTYPTI
jgi:hypothetical protein